MAYDFSSFLSKITLPKMVENYLPRENIMKIIDAAPLDQVIYITAPFGYGKTQAVLEWINGRDCKTAFCRLDQSDNQPDCLCRCLSAAISSAVTGEISKDPLDDPSYPEGPLDFLMKTALSVTDTGYTLVLQNLHCIQEPDSLKIIKDLIRPLLGIWRILILSRSSLPSVFNDLILAGHVRFITAEDLRLDTDDIRAFLKQRGYESDEQRVAAAEQYTRGWFAALNAISTAYMSEHSPGYRQTARDYITGFFETEVWDGLDLITREFLMKTCVLDSLNPSACHSLTGSEEASAMIGRLYAQGLFVFKNKGGGYEYHPAFREFLRQKLDDSAIDVADIYIKLGWWLYSQPNYAAAFRYFYDAKFLFGIDKTLKKFNLSDMKIVDFLDAIGPITALDPLELKRYPNIVAKMALIEYLTGNIDRMKELAQILYQWSQPGALPIGPEEYAELYWEAGWLHYLDPDENPLNNQSHVNVVNFKQYAPHLEVLHLDRDAVLGFPSILRGIVEYSPVTVVIENFVKQANEGTQDIITDEYSLFEAHLVLAEYYYETDRIIESLEEIRKMTTIALEQTHAKLYFVCIALLVKIMRAMNNPAEIDDVADLLGKTIRDKNDFFMLPNYNAFLQLNYLKSGNTGFISEFYEENTPRLDKNHYFLLYRKLAYIRGLLSLGEYHQALMIAEGLENLCESYKRVLDLMEVCILKSIALMKLGDAKNAENSLKKALLIGEPYGYVRIFSDDADELMPILGLLNKELKGTYLKKIMISAKKAAPGYTPRSAYSELTTTELKILKSLRDDLTYKEISFEHNIKLSTVRTHIQSIYSKLGVNNKTAAVNEAIQLGIL